MAGLRSALDVQPHLYMGDVTGRPLDYGMVFFGEENKDPEFYPIDIYYDENLTIPAAQPVRTKGGFLNANGDMCEIFSKELTYSVLVLDQYGRKVFYKPDMSRTNLDNNITVNLPYPNAVPRPLAERNADTVSVKDFGAIGDGNTNDTQAILNAIFYANDNQKSIYFPSGHYLFDGGAQLSNGVVITGAGRNTTTIFSRLPSPTAGYLFNCSGVGSGIENMRFQSMPTQTGGSYVVLSGVESYIENFYMWGDYNGILMSGSVARIRHGRFGDCAKGASRIIATGGDTSQVIDDVLMGALDDRTVAKCGIYVHNSMALMITNTSVITMGNGLMIEATSDSDSVYSLYANNCFFDNCVSGMQLISSGGGKVHRCRFANCWFSSSTNDGIYMSGDSIFGIHFDSCHAVLNGGSGISTGANCNDIAIMGGEFCQNFIGIYIGNALSELKIIGATIGRGAGLNGNKIGIQLVNKNISNVVITDNILIANDAMALKNESVGANLQINNNLGTSETIFYTPAITIGGQSTGIAYAYAIGAFSVTGSKVEVSFKIKLTSKGTATGAVNITMPYPIDDSNGRTGGGFITNISNAQGLSGGLTLSIVSNSSNVALMQYSSSGISPVTQSNITDTLIIEGRVTYYK